MYNLTYNTNVFKTFNKTDIIIIILIIYISLILPYLFKNQKTISSYTSDIIDNIYVKTAIFLIIGYISKRNVRVSLFLVIAVLITMDYATKYKFDNNINLTLQRNKINIDQLKQKIEKVPSEKFEVPLIPTIPTLQQTNINSMKENSLKENSIKENYVKNDYDAMNLNSNFSSYDNFNLLL